MQSIAASIPQSPAVSTSRAPLYTGRTFSVLVVLFLAFDSAMKLLMLPPVVEGTAKAGIPVETIVPLGIILLTCTIIYAVPATSVLGAILLTGYLGGAVFVHVRLGDPLFSHILSPVYVGVFAWGGLVLRDARLRALLPLTRTQV